jgi:c-di-GMP-binding flagellar brake protein YcgR
MKDRRRDVRLIEENKVVVSSLTGEVRPGAPAVHYSLTQDISMGGVRLITGVRLGTGDRVRLDITLSRTRKRIRAVAEVRWVRELYDREVFEVGLQFADLDPDDEFALMDHIFGGRDGSAA